jgi:hypothetical protein
MLARFEQTAMAWKTLALRLLARRFLPDNYGPLDNVPLDFYFEHFAPGRLKGYDGESEASAALSRVAGHTMISYERAITLYQQVCHLEESGIEGALVECGVWKGGAAALMALANLEHGRTRREIHLFDSFQGLPEPSSRDGQHDIAKAQRLAGRSLDGSGALRPVGWDRASREDSEALLREVGYPLQHVHYHEGWFQDTLARSDFGDIALLRLDGDWYDSTKACLDVLYPRVVPGGFVVIDDYGHREGCRAAVTDYRREHGIGEFLHHIDATGRYLIKPRV